VAVQPADQQPQPVHPDVQRLIDAAQIGATIQAGVAVSKAAVTAGPIAVTVLPRAAAEIVGAPVELAAHAVKWAVILRVLRRLFRRHHMETASWLETQLRKQFPDLDPAVIRQAVEQELKFERAFQAKALKRAEADFHAAGQLPTPEAQATRVQQILNREKHYSQLREQALLDRAMRFCHNATVKAISPDGAKWVLGQRKTHTPGCVAMAGKNWPWPVLDVINPPVHTGCGCELRPLRPGDTVPPVGTAMNLARQAMALEEAVRAAAPGEIEAWLQGQVVRPVVARALQRLQEGTYEEALHPRGRGGKWIGKLLSSPGFTQRRQAHEVHDAFRRGEDVSVSKVVDSRAEATKQFKTDFLAAMREARPGYGTGKVQIAEGSVDDPELIKRVQQAAEWFPKEWIDRAGPLRVVESKSPGVYALRAEVAKDHISTIALRKDSWEKNIVHEMMHWLEEKNPEVHKAAQEFLDRRTEGQEIEPLINGAPHEEVKEGGFVDPYMGKIYNHPSTEVLTMAMEGLVAGAIRVEDDPDHFAMLLSTLTGQKVEPSEVGTFGQGFDLSGLKTAKAKTAATAAARAIETATGVVHPVKFTHLDPDDPATARSLPSGHIAVDESTSPHFQISAIVHEYAHNMDRSVLGSEDDWFTQHADESGPLYKALMASPTVQKIKNDEVEILKGDPRTTAQLLQARELFARAFEQYVAMRGGNERLRENLRKLQGDRLLSFQQWQDDEFKPIAAEMDKIVRQQHAVQESKWTEWLHPRGRGGQWVDAIQHVSKEIEQPEAHEGFTGEDFARGLDGFTHGDLTAMRMNRTDTQNLFGEVWLNVFHKGRGEPVGMARVTIKPPTNQGVRSIEFNNIVLKEAEQNQGFGKAFTDHLFKVAREGGVDKMEIEAVSVGGYAWARRGFVWTGDKGAQQRAILADAKEKGRYQAIQEHVRQKLLEELDRKIAAGEFTSEAELAAFGHGEYWKDEDGNRTWLGKELMMGSHWEGDRPITVTTSA